jgi:chromosomal replication initiation ATPase DnaA
MNTTHNENSVYWEQALDIIARTTEPKAFMTWFKDTTATYDGETFFIDCTTAFAKEWLYSRYWNVILSTVEQVTGNDTVKVAFRTSTDKPEKVNKDRVSIMD